MDPGLQTMYPSCFQNPPGLFQVEVSLLAEHVAVFRQLLSRNLRDPGLHNVIGELVDPVLETEGYPLSKERWNDPDGVRLRKFRYYLQLPDLPLASHLVATLRFDRGRPVCKHPI